MSASDLTLQELADAFMRNYGIHEEIDDGKPIMFRIEGPEGQQFGAANRVAAWPETRG